MKRLLLIFMISIAGCQQNDQLKKDWASQKRYAADNAKLDSVDAPHRVVFMGNSIMEEWSRIDPVFFQNQSYINRGISGQTTAQMLVRFRQDVIELKPKVVIILAGTNDIAQNTGPITVERIAGNIFSMAEMAKANGIEPVLCSVLPVKFYYWRKNIRPIPLIRSLNEMIRNYCNTHNMVYIDYYSALVNKESGLDWKYTRDGVHPNADGYRIMDSLTSKAIQLANQEK